MYKVKFVQDPAQKAELTKTMKEEQTPKFLERMEKMLKLNGGGKYIAGGEVSLTINR